MKKFNLNQRKAMAELINNLSVSIIVIGIVTPFFSRGTQNSFNFINFLTITLVSFLLVFLSNYLLT